VTSKEYGDSQASEEGIDAWRGPFTDPKQSLEKTMSKYFFAEIVVHTPEGEIGEYLNPEMCVGREWIQREGREPTRCIDMIAFQRWERVEASGRLEV